MNMDPINVLDSIVQILPHAIGNFLQCRGADTALDLILDIGRHPELRYAGGNSETLDNVVVKSKDLELILGSASVSAITEENRAGITETLHRISVIRDTSNGIVGLTIRIGRTFDGCIALLQDLVDTKANILLLGRPGVGKTSNLRSIANFLAKAQGSRVIIVDTSNEIAGAGTVPHAAVGRARRMMVPTGKKQADIMIEAVKNHTPEVIIIDEISTSKEAKAAATISERGVRLIATAHGNTLKNVIDNAELNLLLGKIASVTRTDSFADKHGVSKTQLEREGAAVFDVVVELSDFNTISVHHDVEQAVDAILRGGFITPEIRTIRDGQVYCTPRGATPSRINVEPQESRIVEAYEDDPYERQPRTSRKQLRRKRSTGKNRQRS